MIGSLLMCGRLRQFSTIIAQLAISSSHFYNADNTHRFFQH
jgi:hypothetical protein